MKASITVVGGLCVLMCLWGGAVYANSQVKDPTTMAVAPNTLLLRMDQGDVSVHTAIPYSLVDVETLTMEGLVPIAVGADVCGDLVMKFAEEEVKALPAVAPPEVTLTVTGALLTGEPITLTDTVQVK